MDDFDKWNKVKQRIDIRCKRIFFKEREVWWIAIGRNIGHEENGKNTYFERPVLVYKKVNRKLLIGLPLTTKYKGEYYKFLIGKFNRKNVYVIWNQPRILSCQRLIRKTKIAVPQNVFIKIKETLLLYLK